MAPSRRRSSRTSAPPAPPRRDAAAATPKKHRRYELIKPIGKGKFAVVYRARRIADDELVALKKIAVDSMDHRAREKCLKEVRLLQSLHHPNIIRYYESFRSGSALYIVMEVPCRPRRDSPRGRWLRRARAAAKRWATV